MTPTATSTSSTFTSEAYGWMKRAVRLARRGLNTTTPNPRVGCVIVKGGQVVGEGWHVRAGEPHAEVHALRNADGDARGATVYVTLEPCSHFGRTPPCADALVAAGVAEVVVAMEDPNPLVAGRGIQRLREAGITVRSGLLADEAKELNQGYVQRMRSGRPWVRVKSAVSLDGKTALLNGESVWITGEPARRDVHRWRARSCAILTGVGTVLHDDPEMTVRWISTDRQPLRVILDSQLRTPPSARILRGEGGVLIFGLNRFPERAAGLRAAGAEVIEIAADSDAVPLDDVLERLGQRGVNELWVEAGATLNGAFVERGLVDEMVIYMAPVLLGDQARGMYALARLEDLNGKRKLAIEDMRMIGTDLRIIARPMVEESLRADEPTD